MKKKKKTTEAQDVQSMNNTRENMKNMFESLPRFDYKVIIFFNDFNEMIKAKNSLMENKILDIVHEELTENYIRQIYKRFRFMPKEGLFTFYAAIIGAILGIFLGFLQVNDYIILPLLAPLRAGGAAVTITLIAFLCSALLAVCTSILMLYMPIENITIGEHMLTIYTNAERKKDIQNILKPYDYKII